MKRSVLSGLSLAAIVLSLAVVGCGSDGIQEGAPTDTKATTPLDPKFVDMTGRSFSDQAKLQAKAAAGGDKPAAGEKAAAAAPVEEKK